jgi:hypothetical protein
MAIGPVKPTGELNTAKNRMLNYKMNGVAEVGSMALLAAALLVFMGIPAFWVVTGLAMVVDIGAIAALSIRPSRPKPPKGSRLLLALR